MSPPTLPAPHLAPRILVVDDEPAIRRVVSQWLANEGFMCLQAASAADVEKILALHAIDLATLDVNMPRRSGLEVLPTIRDRDPDISVIMLTGVSDPAVIVECMSSGATGFLVKPLRREELLFQVRSGLARRREVLARKRAQQDLEALNHTLEHRIQERTKELAQVNESLAREIARRKHAEAMACERELQMQAILETAPDGILTFDETGQIDSLNPAAARLFGYTADQLVGQNVTTLIPSRQRSTHLHPLAHVHLGPQMSSPLIKDFQGRRADGSSFPARLTIAPIKGRPGRAFVCICRDLTEEIALQCELTQAQKLESVGQLAAGIAHEINTPTQYVGDNTRFLNDAFRDLHQVLDSYEQLLSAAKEQRVTPALLAQLEAQLETADLAYLRAEIPQAIQQSLEGIERVSTIVRAMKQFSHPGSEGKTLVDLRDAIHTTMTVARNEWKYVADVVTQFDDSLPCVPCLPGELNQVLLNLIVNAAHAIEAREQADASSKGTITISTRRREQWAEIAISDTGAGIPEKIRSRIFDPFFTTKEVGKGTGQGLAIARSVIVDKHGGRLTFVTECGAGTTFNICLPLEVPY